MKNKRIITCIFLAATVFSQAAIAENKVETATLDVIEAISKDITQGIIEEITKEEVAAATQDYQTKDFERAQPRRSALFLRILDSVVKGSTLAKADMASSAKQSSELLDLDNTLL